nr:hypothetical protein CTI12_AA475510 [Tanacetum cinerariifolium]
MDDEELAVDEMVNTEEHPQDDVGLSQVGPVASSNLPDQKVLIQNRKDKITKADLEGPVFKLLKGTCRSSIQLEYHLEQRYLAFSNQLDWTNPKGNRCPYELTKTLPLQGPSGNLIILVKFFFDNDLEYLKNENKEMKYVSSITKTKAARSRNAAKSPHEVFSHMQILGVVKLTIDNQFGYEYFNEIIVRRVDLKEYSFREVDFSRLHLNDIEDLFLLYVQ